MTNFWSNEKTIEFINEVRVCPELWNVELPKYKDRRHKNDRWRKIGENFQCSSVEAYRKYRSLRTYAKNEEKKKINSVGGKQVKWFAYDALSFVLHQNTPHPGIKSEYTLDVTETLDCDIEADEEEIVETEIADPLLSSVSSQRSHVSKNRSKTVGLIIEEPQNKQEVGKNIKNEYSGFAEHIVNKLSKYDAYTRAQAEFKIMKVLFECDMGMYRYSTDTPSPDNDTIAGTSQSDLSDKLN